MCQLNNFQQNSLKNLFLKKERERMRCVMNLFIHFSLIYAKCLHTDVCVSSYRKQIDYIPLFAEEVNPLVYNQFPFIFDSPC